MSDSFDDVRFPEKIAFGGDFGPTFNTQIISTLGGFEQRLQHWEDVRYKGNVSHEIKNQTEMDDLIAFFMARRGMARSFRYRDQVDFCTDMPGYRIAKQSGAISSSNLDALPADGTITHEPLENTVAGTLLGDGVTTIFQLVKSYTAIAGTDYIREIVKPVANPRIYVNSVLQTISTHYTQDLLTGLITFVTAPADTLTVEWDGLFDIPVRFNVDDMMLTHQFFNVLNWTGIDIVEVRGE